jgi:hypothetical protein
MFDPFCGISENKRKCHFYFLTNIPKWFENSQINVANLQNLDKETT